MKLILQKSIKCSFALFCIALSQSSWALAQNNMCDFIENNSDAKCSSNQELLGTEQSFNKNFIKYEGFHKGNNEQQMYKASHVIWNDKDKTVSLLAESKPSNGHPFS